MPKISNFPTLRSSREQSIPKRFWRRRESQIRPLDSSRQSFSQTFLFLLHVECRFPRQERRLWRRFCLSRNPRRRQLRESDEIREQNRLTHERSRRAQEPTRLAESQGGCRQVCSVDSKTCDDRPSLCFFRFFLIPSLHLSSLPSSFSSCNSSNRRKSCLMD